MLVRQEPSLHHGHVVDAEVGDAAAQHRDHRRRHVDSDHVCAATSSSDRKDPGAGAEVDERRVGSEPVLDQALDILRGVEPGLALVPGDILLVEVLGPGVRELVQPP